MMYRKSMKRSKTAVSRTFAKVKTRISSLGSPDSPNPLRAPSRTASSSLQPCALGPSIIEPDLPASPLPLPMITALQIETSSWIVFDTHPRYHTTAYINIDVSTIAQNAASKASTRSSAELETAPGELLDLEMLVTISGPAIKLTEYGCSTQSRLKLDQHWTNVIYIGLKDTSLASKLTTSFRSLGNRTGGRMRRYTSLDVINKWLDVLQNDSACGVGSGGAEPVYVTVTVKYRHSILPKDTKLENVAVCEVTRDGRDEEENRLIAGVDQRGGDGADERADEVEREAGEEEDEERLKEARVYGAPWM